MKICCCNYPSLSEENKDILKIAGRYVALGSLSGGSALAFGAVSAVALLTALVVMNVFLALNLLTEQRKPFQAKPQFQVVYKKTRFIDFGVFQHVADLNTLNRAVQNLANERPVKDRLFIN